MIRTILLTLLAAIPFMLLFVFTVIVLTMYFVQNSKYKKANSLLKKTPFLVDTNSYLNPSFVAYIALRANDLDHADKIVVNLKPAYGLSVVYLLRIALLAKKGDWGNVNQQYIALEAAANAEDVDTSPLDKLKISIKNKDAPSVLSYFKISGFGRISSPLHDSIYF